MGLFNFQAVKASLYLSASDPLTELPQPCGVPPSNETEAAVWLNMYRVVLHIVAVCVIVLIIPSVTGAESRILNVLLATCSMPLRPFGCGELFAKVDCLTLLHLQQRPSCLHQSSWHV